MPREVKFYPRKGAFPRMIEQLQPRKSTGVTHGGSSKKFAGAKQAATNGLYRPQKKGK